jgi:hypothetical protein
MRLGREKLRKRSKEKLAILSLLKDKRSRDTLARIIGGSVFLKQISRYYYSDAGLEFGQSTKILTKNFRKC